MKILRTIGRAVGSAAFIKLVTFVLLLVAMWLVARRFDFSVPAMRTAIEARGLLEGAGVLAGLYFFTTIAPISARDILKVLGVLFLGPLVSGLAIWIADVAAAVVLFFVAKWLGREAVEKWTGRRMAWINRRLEERGFRNMLILRLLPTPYRHLNLLAGVTRISLSDFFWGTVAGSLVRTLAIQFLLWPFVDLLVKDESSGTTLIWIAMGGLATMMVLMYGVYRLARRLAPGFFRVDVDPSPGFSEGGRKSRASVATTRNRGDGRSGSAGGSAEL